MRRKNRVAWIPRPHSPFSSGGVNIAAFREPFLICDNVQKDSSRPRAPRAAPARLTLPASRTRHSTPRGRALPGRRPDKRTTRREQGRRSPGKGRNETGISEKHPSGARRGRAGTPGRARQLRRPCRRVGKNTALVMLRRERWRAGHDTARRGSFSLWPSHKVPGADRSLAGHP